MTGHVQDEHKAQRVALCSAAVAAMPPDSFSVDGSKLEGAVRLSVALLTAALSLQDEAAAGSAAAAAAAVLNRAAEGLGPLLLLCNTSPKAALP